MKPPPLPKHAACTPDDPVARRAQLDPPRYALVGSGEEPAPEFADFVDAKRALDAHPQARAVRCTACGALLSQHGPARPGATERLARTAARGYHHRHDEDS